MRVTAVETDRDCTVLIGTAQIQSGKINKTYAMNATLPYDASHRS